MWLSLVFILMTVTIVTADINSHCKRCSTSLFFHTNAVWPTLASCRINRTNGESHLLVKTLVNPKHWLRECSLSLSVTKIAGTIASQMYKSKKMGRIQRKVRTLGQETEEVRDDQYHPAPSTVSSSWSLSKPPPAVT